MNPRRSALLTSEDWWSVWVGLGIFALSLLVFAGADVLGWAVQTREWLRPGEALGAVSGAYAGLPGPFSALLTYLFLLVVMCVGAAFLQADLKKFALGFTKSATGELDVFRKLFFAMTFFSIGLISNFRKLWEEGIGRLAAVYLVSLFGFIIWIGLAISWIFFHGIMPPLAAG